jgi:hypothetical protein
MSPRSKKKITMVSCAVDRFNHATNRRFGCTPILNHDQESLFKIRSTQGNGLYQKNMAPIFEDTQRGNDAAREFLRCEEWGAKTPHVLCLLICISLATIYSIYTSPLYFTQPLLLGLVMCVA